jgi:hypothetical protein
MKRYLYLKSGLAAKYLILILMVFVITGCAFKVKLVGDYDGIMDQAVTSLQEQTNAFLQKMINDSTQGASYEKNKDFYINQQSKIAALITRSEISEKGTKIGKLTDLFKQLQTQYQDLENLHQNAPPKEIFISSQKAFNQSFGAILKSLLYLKWGKN